MHWTAMLMSGFFVIAYQIWKRAKTDKQISFSNKFYFYGFIIVCAIIFPGAQIFLLLLIAYLLAKRIIKKKFISKK